MFENYNNISTSYTPCNINVPSSGCEKFTRPLEEYDARDRLVGYSWRLGDSVVLEFITEGDVTIEDEQVYEDAETYLDGKSMRFTMYDFRYQAVYTCVQPAEVITKFIIDKNTSSRIVKGTYRCSLVLVDADGTDTTLVRPEDYILTIK